MKKQEAKQKEKIRDNTPLLFLMLLLVPLYGGYYDWTVLLTGGLLAVLLVYTWARDRELILPAGPESLVLTALAAVSLLTVPFAVSPGMALTGALRPVVWLLFFWYAATYTEAEKERILDDLALEGAVLALISCGSFLYNRFSAHGLGDLNGRLDGFFEYANSWGLYLLVCLILLLWRKERRKRDYGAMAVLVVGLLLTGSRGVILLMLLLLPVWILDCLRSRQSGKLLPVLSVLGGFILLCGLAVWLSGGLLLERLSAIGASSSSLNGRLLYWLDGLHMMADHPLGVGRGGYLYLEPLYQTGDYVTRFVHNEYLQMALDGGWAAGLLMAALPLSLLLRRGTKLRDRLVIGVIALHAFTDFDLQFTVLTLLMLLCGSCGQRKTRMVSLLAPGRFRLSAGLGGAAAALMVLLSVPYLFSAWGRDELAYRLCPGDLELAEKQLIRCGEKPTEAEAVADRILEQTELSVLAWDARAEGALARGDLAAAAEARLSYLRLNPYRGEVYTDFAALLESAFEQGSPAEQERCRVLAAEAAELLSEVRERTSPLADRIADRPDWSFCDEVQSSLNRLAEAAH